MKTPRKKTEAEAFAANRLFSRAFGGDRGGGADWSVSAWLVSRRIDHSPADSAELWIVDLHDDGSLWALTVRVIDPDNDLEPGATSFVDLCYESEPEVMVATAKAIAEALAIPAIFELADELLSEITGESDS